MTAPQWGRGVRNGSWTVAAAYLLFIGLGLTSGLLGLAWPSMRAQFRLPLDGLTVLYLVQTGAYTVAGFFIGRLMSRFGSARVLVAGIATMCATMFCIAATPSWATIVALGAVYGFGSGMVDAGLNLYVAAYHSAREMNFLHASFGVGITCGPVIMTGVLRSHLPWQTGYAAAGALLIVPVLVTALLWRLWRTEGFTSHDRVPASRAPLRSTALLPVVWLSMATFLVYVGLEIGIGQWAYTVLTESRRFPTAIAGPWVSGYWGLFTGGRILFGLIGNRLPIGQVLRWAMLATVGGAALFWWNPTPAIGLLGLALLGFSQAPAFPMLMAETAERVGGVHAENTISLQMTAVGVGCALLPGLIGTIGARFGLEQMAFSFVWMAVIVFACHEASRFFASVEASSTSAPQSPV